MRRVLVVCLLVGALAVVPGRADAATTTFGVQFPSGTHCQTVATTTVTGTTVRTVTISMNLSCNRTLQGVYVGYVLYDSGITDGDAYAWGASNSSSTSLSRSYSTSPGRVLAIDLGMTVYAWNTEQPIYTGQVWLWSPWEAENCVPDSAIDRPIGPVGSCSTVVTVLT